MSRAVKVQRIIEVEVPGLGEEIKRLRQLKQNEGLTLTQLASSANMSTQNWYRIEKESQALTEDVLRLIEQALDHSFDISFDAA